MRLLAPRVPLAIFFLALSAFPQTEFEAASVKPSAPGARAMRCAGGPGTSDPGTLTCENNPLAFQVMMAYNLRPFQLNAPGWMDTARFDVSAKIAPNTGRRAFEQMQRKLLAERFGLAAHFEKRQMPGYELVVAKGGAKLKRTEQPVDEKPTALWRPPSSGPPRRVMAHTVRKAEPVAELASFLSDQLGRPVIDKTGLTGRYDYQLSFLMEPGGRAAGPAASGDGGPEFGVSLMDAVRDELGLALEKTTVEIEVLIVDYAEKSPTGN